MEPFVLSTHSVPQRLQKLAQNQQYCYATTSGASTSDGYVTVAAQGDGVHVLDVSSLHPVASYTLGPSTTFSCPPVTVSSKADIFTTFAGVASAPDTDDSGRTLWIWEENTSTAVPVSERVAQKKKAVQTPHPFIQLYATPARLLALSKTGDIAILSLEDGSTRKTFAPGNFPSGVTQDVIRSFILPRPECTFIPSHSAPAGGEIIVQPREVDGKLYLRVVAIDDNDELIELGDALVALEPSDVLDISLSSDGHTSILCKDGAWHLFRLESFDDVSLELNQVVEPLRLAGFSFLSDKSIQEVSLLARNSSLILLAGVSKSPREVVLLLWDLQYGVLLASQTLPIPGDDSNHGVSLKLVGDSPGQVVLLITPSTPNAKKSKSSTVGATHMKSTVMVVPLIAPPQSTIANAMGRAKAGAAWLAPAPSSPSLASTSSSAPSRSPTKNLSASQQKLLTEMRKQPQNTSKLFFEWEKSEADAGSMLERGSFIKDVLDITFPTSSATATPAKNTPYSAEVVRHLLSKRLITSSMLEETGILRALRLRADWKSIDLAFEHVIDLNELEIMETLAHVVAHHRVSKSDDAMQVDSATPSTIPTLAHFLSHAVPYRTTPSALRIAIRRTLVQAEDVLAVLEVLESWIKGWGKKEAKLLPTGKDLKKNEDGVPVVSIVREKDGKEKGLPTPELQQILTFTQSILDASLVSLIQNSSSRPILKRLQNHVEPVVGSLELTEKLRAALIPYVKLHQKTLREARERTEFPDKKAVEPDWRVKRRIAKETSNVGIGLYRLEELII